MENLILFILWASIELWLIIMLIIALIANNKSEDIWHYVKTSPIIFYLAITKFLGFYGALDQNVILLLVHIVLSAIYIVAIALSFTHWIILGKGL
jgi:hypothetical protein